MNFYERGLFPPAAFHSEGHQDGMGVCLYLALMKRLFGAQFTFALLDDVVMSVDVDHRYQFCKLLKQHFPDTQFIITTHDRLWAEQMKAAGLVTTKTSMAVHSWTIDTGPLVESHQEIWDEIAAALGRGKVETAAAALRRHLEYVSRHLADQLGAKVQFRADGNFELGDLLPTVLARTKDLYGKAAEAAQSWGNNAGKDAAGQRKATLAASAGAYNVEQWAVNKAVHYNEWANFGRKDFEPVVAAFKEGSPLLLSVRRLRILAVHHAARQPGHPALSVQPHQPRPEEKAEVDGGAGRVRQSHPDARVRSQAPLHGRGGWGFRERPRASASELPSGASSRSLRG